MLSSLNINIDIKKLIKLIFTIILLSIIIYLFIKIFKKIFCKKELITLPQGLLYTDTNDIAFYTITSSSLF